MSYCKKYFLGIYTSYTSQSVWGFKFLHSTNLLNLPAFKHFKTYYFYLIQFHAHNDIAHFFYNYNALSTSILTQSRL